MTKKLFFFLLLLTCASSISAQHISFAGIKLGQSESVVDRNLRQKGFAFQGINNVFLSRMYEGAFWNYDKSWINLYSENGIATGVLVSPQGVYYHSNYNKLVKALDKKYGKHYNASGRFNMYLLGDERLQYYWKVAGGYIVTYCLDKENSNQVSFAIYFLDNLSNYVTKERGRSRNRSNDL